MKLVFKKSEDSQINVFLNIDGNEAEFVYIDMIKKLIDSKNMEEPEISEGFTDAETKSIKSMVAHINKEITTADESNTPE